MATAMPVIAAGSVVLVPIKLATEPNFHWYEY
jgi:hypothetical protein